MEQTTSNCENSSDLFFDAFDTFNLPDFNENFISFHSSPPVKTGNQPDNHIKDVSIFNVGETSTSTLSSDQTLELRRDDSSAIVSLADLVIQALFFQVNMLIRCLTFPIWLTYNSFLLVANPLGTLRRTIDTLKKREEGVVKLVGRMACGCFWFFYVGIALSGLLMTGFLCAGFLMMRVVEEPLQMMKSLNFDYIKASPDVIVMLRDCEGVGCSLEFDGENVVGRVIPINHKLQLSVSLTLPESDYNRNLGVFQVRVEFLSTNGKVTSRMSKPCMLRFKSSHIRFMETFIKSGPLLAGYSSESQVIDLELSSFTEGYEPTMGIRIVLEKRAEFRQGAGIPEIYAASLKLESELPLLKWIIWNWRKTLLIWLAMGFFIWELLIVLLCCRPLLFPRGRRIDDVSPDRRQRVVNSNTT